MTRDQIFVHWAVELNQRDCCACAGGCDPRAEFRTRNFEAKSSGRRPVCCCDCVRMGQSAGRSVWLVATRWRQSGKETTAEGLGESEEKEEREETHACNKWTLVRFAQREVERIFSWPSIEIRVIGSFRAREQLAEMFRSLLAARRRHANGCFSNEPFFCWPARTGDKRKGKAQPLESRESAPGQTRVATGKPVCALATRVAFSARPFARLLF